MNCDRIARWYRWLEYIAFGRALERRREALLAHVSDARRVLVLGDGDGRGLAALLHASPAATVDVIDLSERMLELARARAGSERVRYSCADALAIALPDTEYDLVVTHFFLDCFEEADLGQVVERVARAVRPDARWIISEFRGPGLLIAMLYLFFRITTGLKTRRLVDHHPFLDRHGFRLVRCEADGRGRSGAELVSELWERCLPRVY